MPSSLQTYLQQKTDLDEEQVRAAIYAVYKWLLETSATAAREKRNDHRQVCDYLIENELWNVRAPTNKE